MKAIVVHEFGGPEVMKLEEIPKPAPGAGQLLVRIGAAGINPADTYMRTGTYARKPALPYTPGFDGAGIIESVGPNVTGWKPNDRVYLNAGAPGTYAEYIVVDAANAHPLPERSESPSPTPIPRSSNPPCGCVIIMTVSKRD